MSKYSIFLIAASLCAGFASQAAHANTDALAFYQQQQTTAPKEAAPARPGRAADRAAGHGPAAGDVARLAEQMGVPRALALSVCQVETRCRYGLVGRQGERGPLQIKLQTARGLGYSGSAGGLNGYQGAYWGMKHLAAAYARCGTARGAAKLHQAGLASSCSGSAYASRVLARM
jgi:soluble lytic murein transglycosylase-like protein